MSQAVDLMMPDAFFAQAVEELAYSSLPATNSPNGHAQRLRALVEDRLSKNSVWEVTLRGFIDNPNDPDLRANVEFILRRVANSDTEFLTQLTETMGRRSASLGSETAAPSSARVEIKGNRNKIKDVAGRDINKSRTVKIGTAGLLALILLGGGSYATYKARQNSGVEPSNHVPASDLLSSARLSLPGVSIAIPRGWQIQSIAKNATIEGLAAYTDREPCQSFLPDGYMCTKGGANVGRISPDWGTSPRLAAEHFFRIHLFVRKLTVLHRQTLRIDGCIAYALKARVTYPERPNAIEEYVAIRTGPVANPEAVHLPNHASLAYKGSDLSYVLLGFDDTANAPPQSLMDAIAASIQCNS